MMLERVSNGERLPRLDGAAALSNPFLYSGFATSEKAGRFFVLGSKSAPAPASIHNVIFPPPAVALAGRRQTKKVSR